MKPLAVCATFRNEAPYVLEWVAYHSMIGFDHFVLYDNKSADDGAALLKSTPFSDNITVIDWPKEPGQLAAYQHYINHFRDRFEWTAFIDVDEFVHLLDGRRVGDLLCNQERFAGVLLQWLIFGPSGWEQRPPGLVIDNYSWRTPEDEAGNRHVKTLARNAALSHAGPTPHTFELVGPVCDATGRECPNQAIQDNPSHEGAVINHYFTKSRQEWIEKLGRGKATTTSTDDQYRLELFDHVASTAKTRDERMQGCAWALRRVLHPYLPFGRLRRRL